MIRLGNSLFVGDNGGTTGTTAFTCTGPNRILLVGVQNFQNTGTTDRTTGVTYAGVALTLITNVQVPTLTGYWNSFWYLANPASGTNNVVVTLSSNVLVFDTNIAFFNGVDPTAPINVSGTATTSAGTTLTKTLTTTVGNCMNVGNFMASGQNMTAGANTREISGTVNKKMFDSGFVINPVGNTTLTITTGSNDNMCMVMASLKPASQGVPSTI